jgi:hypothetical protein
MSLSLRLLSLSHSTQIVGGLDCEFEEAGDSLVTVRVGRTEGARRELQNQNAKAGMERGEEDTSRSFASGDGWVEGGRREMHENQSAKAGMERGEEDTSRSFASGDGWVEAGWMGGGELDGSFHFGKESIKSEENAMREKHCEIKGAETEGGEGDGGGLDRSSLPTHVELCQAHDSSRRNHEQQEEEEGWKGAEEKNADWGEEEGEGEEEDAVPEPRRMSPLPTHYELPAQLSVQTGGARMHHDRALQRGAGVCVGLGCVL